MANGTNDPESVTAVIEKLDPDFGKIVAELRRVVLNTSEMIGEHIKWNSPSFFYMGEMRPFNPKEYKRDIAVMNLRKGRVLLILPTGARIEDDSGLLEGDYADGRRLIPFNNLDDVKNKASDLQTVILKWIRSIE